MSSPSRAGEHRVHSAPRRLARRLYQSAHSFEALVRHHRGSRFREAVHDLLEARARAVRVAQGLQTLPRLEQRIGDLVALRIALDGLTEGRQRAAHVAACEPALTD